MGCGCGGKRKSSRRTPTVTASISKGTQKTSAGPTPAELRALGTQTASSFTESRQMDAQRRRIEKLRRAAIRSRLNK